MRVHWHISCWSPNHQYNSDMLTHTLWSLLGTLYTFEMLWGVWTPLPYSFDCKKDLQGLQRVKRYNVENGASIIYIFHQICRQTCCGWHKLGFNWGNWLIKVLRSRTDDITVQKLGNLSVAVLFDWTRGFRSKLGLPMSLLSKQTDWQYILYWVTWVKAQHTSYMQS